LHKPALHDKRRYDLTLTESGAKTPHSSGLLGATLGKAMTRLSRGVEGEAGIRGGNAL